MSKARNEYLDKMLGIEGAAELLEKEGIDAVVKKLEEVGIQHKADEKPETASGVSSALVVAFANIIEEVADLAAMMDDQAAEIKVMKELREKAVSDQQAALEQLQKEVTVLTAAYAARPKVASKTEETIINPKEIPAEITKQMTERDPFWGVDVNPNGGQS